MTRRPRRQGARIEEAIARLVAHQHGVVTRGQLIDAGVPAGVIDRRVAVGRQLQRVHRGVYLVGPAPPPRAREMAACLACGPSAVLSHRSAGVLWALVRRRDRSVIDVTIRSGRRIRPGIRVRRAATLHADETTHHMGIPVTTPARTLVDLSGVVRLRTLEQALAKALDDRLTSLEDVERLVDRHSGRKGVRRLRELAEVGSPDLTRSEAEERLLDLIRRAKLERPRTNVEVAHYEVDFYWPSARLAVEVDGFAFHSSRGSFERDRWRDATLAGEDVTVLRVTWRRITEEPEAVVAQLAKVLALARSRGS